MDSRISYLTITFEEHPTIEDQFEVRFHASHKIGKKPHGQRRRMWVTGARPGQLRNGPRIESILELICNQFPASAEAIPAMVPGTEGLRHGI